MAIVAEKLNLPKCYYVTKHNKDRNSVEYCNHTAHFSAVINKMTVFLCGKHFRELKDNAEVELKSNAEELKSSVPGGSFVMIDGKLSWQKIEDEIGNFNQTTNLYDAFTVPSAWKYGKKSTVYLHGEELILVEYEDKFIVFTESKFFDGVGIPHYYCRKYPSLMERRIRGIGPCDP